LLAVHKQLHTSGPKNMVIVQSNTDGVAERVSAIKEARTAPMMPHLGQHYGESTKYSRITLRLHRPTAIRVADRRNRILFDGTLESGDTFRVPDISGVRLSSLDGGAIEIILDNTTVGFAGRVGVPARGISLDPTAIRRLAHAR
jgi:cytoskeleton protein RodZ